ncbi:MAG: sensor histidine kinase, partial [Pontibacterium sp.]
ERESKPVHSGGPGEFAEIDQRIDWLSNRLTDLENEKMRFLRHVSHELKTPLSVLVEGSDLLDEGVTGSLTEPQREVVGMLQENAVKLQLLIDQLLDYNKLSATNTLNIEVVDITQTVHNIINRHKMLIAQRSIRTLLPNHPQLWKTDADLLQRVLANLISNAVHYGQQEGVLTITIIDEGLQLHVDVKNSGVPIQAEDIPHLFEPFYQGKQERDGAVQGTGIGLSIAQDAAKALGGVLSLKDNKDNQVCFRLTLEQQNESKDLG